MEWHNNIKNDPYEPYRQAPHGCRDILITAGVIIIVLAMVLLTGCKTTQPISVSRDSVRVEYRLDSVYVLKHDSVFRDRWRSGDTIYITTEKYQIRYKDKLVQVHDTITTTQTEQIAVKYVPNYYRNTSAGFWVLLVILLALTAWRLYKLYIKIKTGGLL